MYNNNDESGGEFRLPFEPLAELANLDQLEAKTLDLIGRFGPDPTAWPATDAWRLFFDRMRVMARQEANEEALIEARRRWPIMPDDQGDGFLPDEE